MMLRLLRWPAGAAMVAALSPIPGLKPAGAAPLPAWVEIVGPGGKASIRVITDSASCPVLTVGNEQLRMEERAKPGPLFPNDPAKASTVFPVLTCEVAAPEGKTAVLPDGRALPLPTPDPQRIVVLGDTGCRIKEKKHGDFDTQDCAHDWPYAKIAADAAAARPDLVIHVGDYLYREVPCPAGNMECANSPFGDKWDTWNADFFAPSEKLLAAAPWVMVRGNHETCSRASDGWFRFLDHAKPASACEKMSSSFVVKFGDFGFVVVDSAQAADPKTKDEEEEEDTALSDDLLRRKFADAGRDFPPQTWLLTHRPFNAVRVHKHKQEADNTLLQGAIGPDLPPAVKMIVSGHIHMFEAFSFGDGDPPRPAQLVVGTGGDELGKKPDDPETINDAPVTDATIRHKFGYMVWDRDGTKWKGALIDEDGAELARCKLTERSLTCKKEH
jgi:hypothetical protein